MQLYDINWILSTSQQINKKYNLWNNQNYFKKVWAAAETPSSGSVCNGGGRTLESETGLLLRPAPVSTSVAVWRLNQVHREGVSPHSAPQIPPTSGHGERAAARGREAKAAWAQILSLDPEDGGKPLAASQ